MSKDQYDHLKTGSIELMLSREWSLRSILNIHYCTRFTDDFCESMIL
jgi:hypothetical protein